MKIFKVYWHKQIQCSFSIFSSARWTRRCSAAAGSCKAVSYLYRQSRINCVVFRQHEYFIASNPQPPFIYSQEYICLGSRLHKYERQLSYNNYTAWFGRNICKRNCYVVEVKCSPITCNDHQNELNVIWVVILIHNIYELWEYVYIYI